jgi:hypothetical protein
MLENVVGKIGEQREKTGSKFYKKVFGILLFLHL